MVLLLDGFRIGGFAVDGLRDALYFKNEPKLRSDPVRIKGRQSDDAIIALTAPGQLSVRIQQFDPGAGGKREIMNDERGGSGGRGG